MRLALDHRVHPEEGLADGEAVEADDVARVVEGGGDSGGFAGGDGGDGGAVGAMAAARMGMERAAGMVAAASVVVREEVEGAARMARAAVTGVVRAAKAGGGQEETRVALTAVEILVEVVVDMAGVAVAVMAAAVVRAAWTAAQVAAAV